jgi:hypothetical protein
MSIMNTELYNALRAANVPDELAEAAAQSVAPSEGAATQADLVGIRAEINQLRVELRAAMSDLRAELIKWMVGLHAATLLALIGAVIAIMGKLP